MSRLIRTIIQDATVYFLVIFTSHFVFEMALLLVRVSVYVHVGCYERQIEGLYSRIYNSCQGGERRLRRPLKIMTLTVSIFLSHSGNYVCVLTGPKGRSSATLTKTILLL